MLLTRYRGTGAASVGADDPWSDWRIETETTRDSASHDAVCTPPPDLMFYSDGTELLSEKHHRAHIPAQTYHLEDVLHTPKSRGTIPPFTPPPTAPRSSARLSARGTKITEPAVSTGE
jgi:hypothetical protein